ncbi:putative type VI secretion system effector [uncultured Gilliamella sp.]|uniref:putative type VI secretion system effector n=1 Tax=uncultured Gilliamella sp. TaxID=1193505 RepID=UPI0025D0C16D|nr:putative type VI secretion system effector [uncultured Gilliamella sp.]
MAKHFNLSCCSLREERQQTEIEKIDQYTLLANGKPFSIIFFDLIKLDKRPIMPYAKYDGTDIIYKDKEELLKKTGIRITDPILPPKNLVKITGTISEFKGIFCFAPLFDGAYLSKEERKKQSAKVRSGAMLGTLSGNSIAGLAALGHGDSIHRSNYFEAQYITAKLNNDIILKGWLGYFKFNDGDLVEVVAEKHTDHYEVYAMLKPSEQIISIIPPCFAGRKHALKRYHIPLLLTYILFAMGMVFFLGDFTLDNLIPAFFGVGVIYLPAILILYKNSINTHVKLAEEIFSTLNWQNIRNIDLISTSKMQIRKLIDENKYSFDFKDNTNLYIRPQKSGAGWYFFYYDPEMFCKKK